MSAMALLLCSIGVLSVCLSSQAGLTVEAEPGDDVTLWSVCTSNVVPMLVLVFGAVIVVLLSVLLFLLFNTLKYRKQHREDSDSKLKQENEEQDGEMMNYVALNFSNKKNRRSHR
ncbi:uncharacterized protein LOC118802768 isoform X2 [Colossoma macropomum]|uniref:uncharacterized protein LOC118802768 isoform X2 n=1 Tax=Colossoma macropomum TaxID=42526 RepID=UPI001863D351|nr:uncharacterized protein LOC118802768 isoform X2 [Colossoma macropomum]